jgi:glycosyltransferase involved in cell wall biosynthesis
LHDKKTGLFCEPSNPKSIAEKIETLIRDKKLRDKLIKNAKQMVGEVYNWDKISERLRRVYKEIMVR